MADPIVNGTQPDATATVPQEQTSSPIPSQLQNATQGLAVDPNSPQAAPQQRPAMQPAAPPPSPASLPITATSPNKLTHSFMARTIGGLLDALAGPGVPSYSTDANGKLVAQPSAPRSTADKVKAIAEHALSGLSAPVDPNQKSGLAKGLAGVGAGVAAVGRQRTAEDQAAKQQAREDFETEQRTTLQKANIAKLNAATHAEIVNARRTGEEAMKSHYTNTQNSVDMMDAWKPMIVTPEELNSLEKNTSTAGPGGHAIFQVHVIGLLPPKPLFQNGQPVTDENGDPVMQKQIAVLPLDPQGKVPISDAVAARINRVAQKAGLNGNVAAGTELTFDDANLVMARVKHAENEVSTEKPQLVFADDGKGGQKVQRKNSLNEYSDATAEEELDMQTRKAKLAEAQLAPGKTKAETNKDNAEADKATADAAKAKQDTANQGSNNSDLTGEEYLATLPTGQQSLVRGIGTGRQVLPAGRKDAQEVLKQVHQAYQDYDEAKAKTWQKSNNEYRGSGKTATQIVPAYNTALEHMEDLYTNTTGDGIFNPLSKAYQDREVALGYVSREVGKAVSAGAMTQKESEDLLGTLKGGLTPSLKRERITKTAQLLHDKIDEYQTKFNESAPSSAVKVPTLISPKAAQAFDYVQSGGKSSQGGQDSKSGQPQNAPQIPSGATRTAPGPDGKMHYTNDQGTKDFGVAQ